MHRYIALSIAGISTFLIPSYKSQCPKVTCTTTKDCYYSITESSNTITNYINWQACDYTNNICHLLTDKAAPDTNGYTKLGQCQSRQDNFKSYAGESCSINTDCLNNQCINNFCASKLTDEACDSTLDCGVGLYCATITNPPIPDFNPNTNANKDKSVTDGTTKKCAAQKQQGQDCTATSDCVNNLACVNAKCTAFYSIGANAVFNTDLTGTLAKQLCSDNTNYFVDKNRATMCKTLKYLIKTDPQTNTFKNVITCDVTKDDSCSYYEPTADQGKVIGTFKCSCGYSSAGNGVCPWLNNNKNSVFMDFVTNSNQRCHSLNRFKCFRKDVSANNKYKALYVKYLAAELTKEAPTCASTDYLDLSIEFNYPPSA